jgi:hypothetical protein
MNFSTAVDRVRDDFNEMPGLELTLPQAVRLWNLGADDCRFAVDALVDVGFLRWTPLMVSCVSDSSNSVRVGVNRSTNGVPVSTATRRMASV